MHAAAYAAEAFPLRPVRLIVPFPPGGSNDIVGRMIAAQLTERLGRQVVVDNRGGAGGTIGSLIQMLPQVRAGRLRALGVGSAKRVAALPEVPTIAEAGVPGYEAANWWGIVAPAGTSADIVKRLNAEISGVLGSAEAQKWFVAEGAEAVIKSPGQFGKFILSEMDKWGRVVKQAGIRAE